MTQDVEKSHEQKGEAFPLMLRRSWPKTCAPWMANGSISPTDVINLLLFVGLNIGDAWLTSQVLDSGWQELNPIVRLYGGNMVAKAFVALATTLVLVRFGKAKLLWILNIFMLVLVLWLSAGLLYFL